MSVPLRFEVGHTVRSSDIHGREFKYYVRKVREDGWMFEPYDRPGELEFHSGESIFEVYFAGRLRYDGFDPAGLTEARRAAMEIAYENQRPERRLRAERRLVFVRAIEKAMRSGDRKGVALVDAAKDVIRLRGDEWRREDQKRFDQAFAARVAKGLTAPGDCAEVAQVMKVPGERTVWTWVKDYVAAGGSIIGLVPGAVGNHGSHLSTESEVVVRAFIESHVSSDQLLRLGAAYKRYRKQELKKEQTPVGRAAFIRRAKAHLGSKRIDALTYGKRDARRLHAVSQAVEEPFWVNQQSEVDHVLFNVNLVDDASGVVLGRPWMSVVRERISGAPKGVHLSFLAPSWPTLSRALAHSVWPKDLSGYPDVKGEWPQHGISDEIITDRGMDMISHAARASAARMLYEIINLPSYMPWLKGGIERWNRTAKWAVLTYAEGIASFKNPDYDGRRLARMSVAEFKAEFVKWLVEENLGEPRGALNGLTANQVWLDGIALHGAPRAVTDPALLRRSTCIPMMRTIQGYGIRVLGYEFWSPELQGLRERLGHAHKYEVLIDPYNLGYIEVLDPHGDWIVCFNKRQDLSAGVTLYQSEMHFRHAGDLKRGEAVTYDDLERAKQHCEQDRDRVQAVGRKMLTRGVQNVLGRYLDIGAFMTPVNLAPVAPIALPAQIPGWMVDNGVYRPVIPGQVPQNVVNGSAPPGAILQDLAPVARAGGAPALKPVPSGAVSLPDLDAAFARRLAESRR